MRLTILDIQYHPRLIPPATTDVAVLCENPLSRFYVNLKQSDLAVAAGGENWSDDDVLAAVQASVNETHPDLGFVVEYPPAPAPDDPMPGDTP